MANTCNFMLLGAGRSGTSLLAAQINHHSQVTCGLEAGAVPLLGQAPPSWWRRNTPLNRIKAFHKQCVAQALKVPTPLYGNKFTTEQLLLPYPDAPELAALAFAKVFSHVPLVFLLRDGRTCIPSKMARGGKSLNEAITFWEYAAVLHHHLVAVHPNILVLKYEALLQHPEKELLRVCEFLGVPFELQMLDATNSTLLPEMYRQPGVVLEKALVPKQEAWHIRIESTLRKLGYV